MICWLNVSLRPRGGRRRNLMSWQWNLQAVEWGNKHDGDAEFMSSLRARELSWRHRGKLVERLEIASAQRPLMGRSSAGHLGGRSFLLRRSTRSFRWHSAGHQIINKNLRELPFRLIIHCLRKFLRTTNVAFRAKCAKHTANAVRNIYRENTINQKAAAA